MMRRSFVGGGGFDYGGVAAGAGPQHHADRHRIRQLRLFFAGDGNVPLLSGLNAYVGS
jgi:hypothetical protein